MGKERSEDLYSQIVKASVRRGHYRASQLLVPL